MHTHVTVVPQDHFISVDGVGYFFTFEAAPRIHAIQWHSGSGHIEYSDGTAPRTLNLAEYVTEVLPYVTLWKQEKLRLDTLHKEQNVPPTLDVFKQQAKEQLKSKRLEMEYVGPLVEVDGVLYRFPSDVKDETRLNSLSHMFTEDANLTVPDWKVGEGQYVMMTAELFNKVKEASFIHISKVFKTERAKLDDIDACASVDALRHWLETDLHEGWDV